VAVAVLVAMRGHRVGALQQLVERGGRPGGLREGLPRYEALGIRSPGRLLGAPEGLPRAERVDAAFGAVVHVPGVRETVAVAVGGGALNGVGALGGRAAGPRFGIAGARIWRRGRRRPRAGGGWTAAASVRAILTHFSDEVFAAGVFRLGDRYTATSANTTLIGPILQQGIPHVQMLIRLHFLTIHVILLLFGLRCSHVKKNGCDLARPIVANTPPL
jgi:hypothetical protein